MCGLSGMLGECSNTYFRLTAAIFGHQTMTAFCYPVVFIMLENIRLSVLTHLSFMGSYCSLSSVLDI